MLVEHQVSSLLVFILVNFTLVCSQPGYEARISIYGSPLEPNSPITNLLKFYVERNPNIQVKTYFKDGNLPTYTSNGNGAYVVQYPNPDPYPGYYYTEENGSELNDIPNGDVNETPTLYYDSNWVVTENPVSSTHSDYRGTNESNESSDVLVYNVTISSQNANGSIGQREQELKDYFTTLPTKQPHIPLEPNQIVPLTTTNASLEVNGTVQGTVTKAPVANNKEISTTASPYLKIPQQVAQNETIEGNVPAPLDQQPNTLLFADPFEESNWEYPTEDDHQTETSTANNFKLDIRILQPSTSTGTADDPKIDDTAKKPLLISSSVGVADAVARKNQIVDNYASSNPLVEGTNKIPHIPNTNNTLKKHTIDRTLSSNYGNNKLQSNNKVEIVHSQSKPPKNLIPGTGNKPTELDSTKTKIANRFPVLPSPPFNTDVTKAVEQLSPTSTPTRPVDDRITFRIRPSKNVAAQNQILVNVFTRILQAITNPRATHQRTKRDSSRYRYTVFPMVVEEYGQKKSRRKTVPARLVQKKSLTSSERVDDVKQNVVDDSHFEKQMEGLYRIFPGKSGNRNSYYEDFEQIL